MGILSGEEFAVYRTPDGKDCLKKTADTGRHFFIAGSYWAAAEMICVTRPTTFMAIASRYVYWAAPITSMGLTFGAVTCMSGTFRKKDDPWNHVIGGLAAGAIMGAKYQKFGTAMSWGVPFALVAGIFKLLKNDGIDIWGRQEPIHKDWFTFDHYRRTFDPNRKESSPPSNY